MISMCSVLFGDMQLYLDVYFDTILKHTKLVKEVVLVQVDAEEECVIKEWTEKDIHFRILGYPLLKDMGEHLSSAWVYMVCGHAMGMHYAIDKATYDCLWLSDPDLFFFRSVDEIYFNLMNKYNLSAIGISHFNPFEQSYVYFPCIINCMTKKSLLPPKEWLQGQIFGSTGMRASHNCVNLVQTDGKYMIAGPIPAHKDKFPNPDGIFDVGCNLWLWNHEQQWRWMSFHLDVWLDCFKDNYGMSELVYPLNYNLKHYKTNFELQDDIGSDDLLYHRTRGSKEKGDSFKNLYHKLVG